MVKEKRQVVVGLCFLVALILLIVIAISFNGKASAKDEAEAEINANTNTTTTTTTTTTPATTTVAAVKTTTKTTKKAVATTTAKTTTVATTTPPTTTTTTTSPSYYWDGPVLTPSNGRIEGPSGQETYYNLDMSGVLNIMYGMGFSGDYWVREDGCKMFGNYIMVAADLNIRPRGSIVQTSLGLGMVCDTGGFTSSNPYQLDIATCW